MTWESEICAAIESCLIGCHTWTNVTCTRNISADSRLASSQWETSLQSNAVSHWLDANLESALRIILLVTVELWRYAPSKETQVTSYSYPNPAAVCMSIRDRQCIKICFPYVFLFHIHCNTQFIPTVSSTRLTLHGVGRSIASDGFKIMNLQSGVSNLRQQLNCSTSVLCLHKRNQSSATMARLWVKSAVNRRIPLTKG